MCADKQPDSRPTHLVTSVPDARYVLISIPYVIKERGAFKTQKGRMVCCCLLGCLSYDLLVHLSSMRRRKSTARLRSGDQNREAKPGTFQPFSRPFGISVLWEIGLGQSHSPWFESSGTKISGSALNLTLFFPFFSVSRKQRRRRPSHPQPQGPERFVFPSCTYVCTEYGSTVLRTPYFRRP